MSIVEVSAQKPAYEPGSQAALPFALGRCQTSLLLQNHFIRCVYVLNVMHIGTFDDLHSLVSLYFNNIVDSLVLVSNSVAI